MLLFAFQLFTSQIAADCPSGFTNINPGVNVTNGNCVKILKANTFEESESECEKIYAGSLGRVYGRNTEFISGTHF